MFPGILFRGIVFRGTRGWDDVRLGRAFRCRFRLAGCRPAANTAAVSPASTTALGRRGAIRVHVRVKVGVRTGGGLVQRLGQSVFVQARRVERATAAAVRQGQAGGAADVVGVHGLPTLPGGQRDRGAGHDHIRAHPVHVERRTDRGDLAQCGVGQFDSGQPVAGGGDPGGQCGLLHRPAGGEGFRVGVVGQPAAHHLGSHRRLSAGCDLDGQPEAVQQLRAQFTFFGVHRPDQQEAGGMAHRHPVAFDVGDTEGGRVQQQVHEMVVQEVDLVDVEQAAMGGGEQPRPQRRDAFGERPVEVDRPGDPVLGGADRQLHQTCRPGDRPGLRWMRAVRAVGVGIGRVAGEPTAGHHGHRREQCGKTAYRRRLGGALLPADEQPADRR